MALADLMANFETALASSITSAAAALTLTKSTDDDGSTLAAQYIITVDEGTNSEEHMLVTFVGAAGTINARGLSRVDMTTEVAANNFSHSRGASVKITNALLVKVRRILNGTEAFPDNAQTLGDGSKLATSAAPVADEDIANKKYIDDIAIAGAPDAAVASKGIIEIATDAEMDAGTETGGTGAKLVGTPDQIAEVIQEGLHSFAADAEASDTYVITLTPAITAYVTGMVIRFTANTANTGAATLNVNALGAKAIKKHHDVALETGDIEAGASIEVMYDGTNMVMQTPINSMPTTAVLTEMSTFFGATDITGAEAQTLTGGAASDASSLHTHTGFSQIIAFNTADVTISNSTAETNIFSTSIPAGTLSTSNVVFFEIPISSFNLAANGSLTIRLKYGATTVSSAVLSEGTGVKLSGMQGVIKGYIGASGATNTQEAYVSMNVFGSGNIENTNTSVNVGFQLGVGTGAEDSTGALNLVVTSDFNSASADSVVTYPSSLITGFKQ